MQRTIPKYSELNIQFFHQQTPEFIRELVKHLRKIPIFKENKFRLTAPSHGYYYFLANNVNGLRASINMTFEGKKLHEIDRDYIEEEILKAIDGYVLPSTNLKSYIWNHQVNWRECTQIERWV